MAHSDFEKVSAYYCIIIPAALWKMDLGNGKIVCGTRSLLSLGRGGRVMGITEPELTDLSRQGLALCGAMLKAVLEPLHKLRGAQRRVRAVRKSWTKFNAFLT